MKPPMRIATADGRQLWADALRGIGIIAIFVAHFLIGEYGNANWAVRVIAPCLLPMFYFVSGYFAKPGRKASERICRNMKSLLVPYLLASCFWWLLDFGTAALSGGIDGAVSDKFLAILLQLPETPWEGGWWFIPSFFLAKMIFEIGSLPFSGNAGRLLVWSFVLAALAWCYTLLGGPRLPWNLEAALFAQPFFALGWLWNRSLASRFSAFSKGQRLAWCAVAFVVFGIALCINRAAGEQALDLHVRRLNEFFSAYTACFSALFLLICGAKYLTGLHLLTFIGQNSIVYFLYGGLAGAITSRMLRLLGWQAAWVRLLVGLAGLSVLLVPVVALLKRFFPAAVGKQRRP